MKLKKWLILLLATAGLTWLLNQIGFSAISDTLRRMGITGASTIVACGLIEALLDGLALQQATLGKVPYARTLIANQTGAFLNMATPVEAGEILKAALLSRHMDGGASTAVLVWNMAARLAKSSVIFIAAGTALLFLPLFQSRAAICLGFAALNLIVYAALALILRFGGVGRTFRFLSRLPFLKGPRTKVFISHIEEAERATSRFWHHHPTRYLAVLSAQIGARAAGLVTTWMALHFMVPETSFFLCLLIFAAMELAGYVVALLPTRIGTMEGSAFLVFGFLGLDGGLGTLLQLTLRLKQLLITGTFSAIGALR